MALRVGMMVLAVACVLACVSLAVAAENDGAAGGKSGYGPLSAGLVGGMAILGAGFAVGRVGSAGAAAIAEKPELFVRALIFIAIAEGLAVFGFVLAFMLMSL